MHIKTHNFGTKDYTHVDSLPRFIAAYIMLGESHRFHDVHRIYDSSTFESGVPLVWSVSMCVLS